MLVLTVNVIEMEPGVRSKSLVKDPRILKWANGDAGKAYTEAIIGDFEDGDEVLFTLGHYPTRPTRGSWRLLIVIALGPENPLWGYFDGTEGPTRWYHSEAAAKSEAQAIAKFLSREKA